MKIKIIYFASLKDKTQKSQEEIETNAQTINQLYDELNQLHHFPIDKKHIRVAVNEEYQNFDYNLNAMDTVVFIPPVAGG